LVLNAAITYRVLSDQHELTRQQVVGGQATAVMLGLDLYAHTALSVTFDARGVVTAKNARFTFHAVRKTIPDLADIGNPIEHSAFEPTVSEKLGVYSHEYALPGLTPAVMEAIRRTEESVMVTGEFSYDNGFGDIQREKVCVYWLTGIPNKTTDQGGANGFYRCEGFDITMSNVLKAEREAKTQN
jgi:hypothetical protein